MYVVKPETEIHTRITRDLKIIETLYKQCVFKLRNEKNESFQRVVVKFGTQF